MKLIHTTFYLFSRAIRPQSQSLRLPLFTHFPLCKQLSGYFQQHEIHTPTYIQYALMSHLYSPNPSPSYHIVSPTGSGKTLAYLLPMVDHIKKEEMEADQSLTTSQRPRGLIFTSSKELVLQVRDVGKGMSHHVKMKCEGVGIGRTQAQEEEKVREGVDVLVTGYRRFKRMLDHRKVFLSNLSWVVVDEVDTIFESQMSAMQQMFQAIISPRLSFPNPPRVIFSSTTNPVPLREYLKKKVPGVVEVYDKNAHFNLHNIKHEFLHCKSYDKHQPLLEELRHDPNLKTMIFCNTVTSLHELQYFLNAQGVPTVTLHSHLRKEARIKNYEYFRDVNRGVLLSTDLGARGLHFPKLAKVINYDFPLTTCDYLQRAGRTGRAGQKGKVISLYFKKHLPVISELKGASFTSPLKITNSAYGFRNREETKRPSKFNRKVAHRSN